MDPKVTEIIFQSGIAGVIFITFGKIIIGLYNNMRDDHQKQLLVSQGREDELIRQLEKFHDNLEKFNESLITITNTLNNMCAKIAQIEDLICKREV